MSLFRQSRETSEDAVSPRLLLSVVLFILRRGARFSSETTTEANILQTFVQTNFTIPDVPQNPRARFITK